MAFLDNSGDIIIDAVLTDTGRYRLAKGDGSFKIVKFALGDDEIDYELYDTSSSDADADLQIMQTPILEAFTNNASSLKSKLISIPRNNILYMPVLKANNKSPNALNSDLSMYVVTADETTEGKVDQTEEPFLFGVSIGDGSEIRVDQGINSNAISPKRAIPSDLEETQYIIEIDNRLGSISSKSGTAVSPAFIDDDNIASYYLTMGNDTDYITKNTSEQVGGQVITGPRGTTLKFAINTSIEVDTGTYLFEQLGNTDANTMTGVTGNFSFIDTTVRIQGATTGVQVDLPIRIIKSQ
tara:strand:- start:526 stop:1416 length:891 start_codon:yes stop_codon:yes gene_type:complete